MVQASKPHGKTQVQLKGMKMTALLSIVTKHNLAQHIHLYKRMKKAQLVQALAAYEKKVPSDNKAADVKSKEDKRKANAARYVQTRGKPTASSAAPALGRGKRVKKPTAKMAALKGKGKTSRPKIGMTYFGA